VLTYLVGYEGAKVKNYLILLALNVYIYFLNQST